MKVGTNFGWTSGTEEDLIEAARTSERYGFDFFGMGDSQSIIREPYTSLGMVARATDSIHLGPFVTNFVTRHPVVSASAMCTLDEISDGRAVMGVGTGDSAVNTLGERPVKLAEMKDTIETIRGLFQGKDVDFDGNEVRLKWVQSEYGSRDVPINLAAEGPKTLNLAGQVADGVIIGTGLHPELIRDSIEKIHEGCAEAGRDPDAVEKWVMARANIRDDYDDAVEEIKPFLAGMANHSFRFTLEGKNVPEEYVEPIKTLKEEYVDHEHVPGETTDTPNSRLVERLELTDFLAERFAIVGTAADCMRKIESIQEVDDVDGLAMVMAPTETSRMIEFFTRMGENVLPAVR